MVSILRTALSVLLLSRIAISQECTADGKLCDTHERCPFWKGEGECFKNADYMAKHCPASCFEDERVDLADPECHDHHDSCPVWASVGECEDNAVNMNMYCAKSCGICSEKSADATAVRCIDSDEKCLFWASKGECAANPVYMHKYCAKSCGTCEKLEQTQPIVRNNDALEGLESFLEQAQDFGERQQVGGSKSEASMTFQVVRESIDYMKNGVENLLDETMKLCLNRNALCAFWATIGECEKNQAYMTTNCAPSCKTCHLINMDTRCPKLPDAVPALKPGDLNKMFERIIKAAPGNRTLTDEERRELQELNMTEYTVNVHSRPSHSPAIEVSPILDRSLPPWVVTFDNFLTPDECQALIDIGYESGYKRSQDVGNVKFDGSFDGYESIGRTSENAWCSTLQGCRQKEVVQRIMDRFERVLGIPSQNSEDLQILKYEKGQFYETHHDYILHQRDRQCGPRILTLFLYLSDVEAGGGTRFPRMDLTILPKAGRALLWPSVFDSDPMNDDIRTSHEALPVEAGIKFAANGWIHQFDYVFAQSRGCN